MKERFSYLLRESLKVHFGRVPSAETVARYFNLRAYDTTPVTQESVRRWVRGECLPKSDHLILLVNWLAMDLQEMKQDPSNNNKQGVPIKTEPLQALLPEWSRNGCSQAILGGECQVLQGVIKKANEGEEKLKLKTVDLKHLEKSTS